MAGGIQTPIRGRRPRLMAEINMTPFVDVMLVLLIVFMVAAPLLTVAVPVDLPDSDATAITEEVEPIAITLQADGSIYVQETLIDRENLLPHLTAVAGTGYEHRIYVRADQALSYGQVMDVTGAIEGAGFKRLALVTQ